jgi:hypothetical protein
LLFITPSEKANILRSKALEFRRMAEKSPFKKDRDRFNAIADDCDRQAKALEA